MALSKTQRKNRNRRKKGKMVPLNHLHLTEKEIKDFVELMNKRNKTNIPIKFFTELDSRRTLAMNIMNDKDAFIVFLLTKGTSKAMEAIFPTAGFCKMYATYRGNYINCTELNGNIVKKIFNLVNKGEGLDECIVCMEEMHTFNTCMICEAVMCDNCVVDMKTQDKNFPCPQCRCNGSIHKRQV